MSQPFFPNEQTGYQSDAWGRLKLVGNVDIGSLGRHISAAKSTKT